MITEVTPNFRTASDDLSKEELNKLQAGGFVGQLKDHFRDLSLDDIVWESEQIAKSHGIYLEFNREKKGKEKDWLYMLRFTIPSGGSLNRDQWRIFDEVAGDHTVDPDGRPSLRLTTRQNIQYHWVRKPSILDIVQRVAQTGFYTLNGCGDNVRNVMGCPLSRFSTAYDASELAHEFGKYFRLPIEPHLEIFGIDPTLERTPEDRFEYGANLLNRKFKIGFSAVHQNPETGEWVADNCVELRTNDLGIAPIVENGKVDRFQVYVGGGQGERNGKVSFAALGQPLGIFHRDQLKAGMDAIVQVHQEWGDRQNRHWARLKYVIHKQGIPWYQDRVREVAGDCFEQPDPKFDIGARHLHHGWHRQPSNGLWAYGAFIENGRIADFPELKLRTLVRHLLDTFPIEVFITPNQDLLFTNLPDEERGRFEETLKSYGYGERNGEPHSTLRKTSVACVGLPTCRLSYTDSERFLPDLIDELDKRGWRDMAESVGISGCERQCSRPSTKSIGWVGSGKDRYQLRLMGAEDARFQGGLVVDADGKVYLKTVPRAQVPDVIEALFENFKAHRQEGESLGYYHHRIGLPAVIEQLKQHPKTAELMAK